MILHVDMDAFFVAVEVRARPELAGKPVVVGGNGRRGVVAAASYEARRYGVHSAMPSARAHTLCPQAIFLDGDYESYTTASEEVQAIFADITPLVEPISIDEAFLDVSGALRLLGDGPTIGRLIRARVADELHLACSVGVAPNKFLAKMASVEAKPQAKPTGIVAGPGVFEVVPGGELDYLHPLPVGRLWGVGPATRQRLSALGVVTIGDLAQVPYAALRAALGVASATRLLELATGRDDRPVTAERPLKSIGHEETYPYDLYDRDEIGRQLWRLADGVATRLRNHGFGARTIELKVRDGSFRTVSRSRTGPTALVTAASIVAVAGDLYDQLAPPGGVRLLGISASKFADPVEQLTLDFDEPVTSDTAWRAASEAIDGVRERFGRNSIAAASSLGAAGVEVIHRGRNPWGPGGAPH